ncbi:uncharacterized protein PAE49_005222 [Odontesthes bonariensis]|uniref:uncharacterized protein LOC142380034 n=1 Tax=Odontesthes bonariensis TaxID=219752 RepID=UPI003F58690E
MKVQIVIPMAILMSVALMGVMKIRIKEQEKAQKRSRFEGIKLRVTNDVLSEYQNEQAEKQHLLEKTKRDQVTLAEEETNLQTRADRTKGDVDHCQEGKKLDTDKLAVMETDLNNEKAVSEKEMTDLNTQIAQMKKELAERSPVCNLLKNEPSPARKMCEFKEDSKAEEKKAEAPKQEEPKAEAPKQEEPKAEAPKQEEPKAEAPKQEEPKVEAQR